ncbi:MAG: hypothetical protein HN478_14580, partial [Rhodospirillaceae bacterium]|nr:hypothetical protein [Rhodospirillaceae bacterium]
FFAALASAAGLALNQATGTWRSDLASTITVEIPPQENAQARLTAVTKALRDTPGIARVRPLQVAEIAKLLQPWLGGGALIDDLPLPHLIDVHLSPEQSVDLVALARQLADIGPDIRIDDHQIWLGKLIRLSRSLQWMMLACLAMICFATCAVVIFGTRAAFTAHLEVVSLLHVMGAQDSYIAKLFLRRAMLMGLKGGLIGLAVTAAALYALSRLAADLEGPLFGNLTLTPLGLLSLAALPLLAALLTAMTAWRTVMRELSRMP